VKDSSAELVVPQFYFIAFSDKMLLKAT